jgi:hypothetical protein
MNALVPTSQQPSNVEVYRASTEAAGICKEIVLATAKKIGDRQYVQVEGWQAIALAHGCTASSRDVEVVPGGVRAVGQVRRMSDGAVIAEAEGFVGQDEPTWYGGDVEKEEWDGPKGNRRKTGRTYTVTLPKRADYAIRAMAQTRSISRACRSAFAHVVVMMNAGLQTTPAEEVPDEGFNDHHSDEPRNVTPAGKKTKAKDETKPAGPSVMLSAALASLEPAKSKSDLEDWTAKNAETVAKMDEADRAVLRARYAELLAKFSPKAEAKKEPEHREGANEHGIGPDEPNGPNPDYEGDAGDNGSAEMTPAQSAAFKAAALATIAAAKTEAELRKWNTDHETDVVICLQADYDEIGMAWRERAEAIRAAAAKNARDLTGGK